MTNTADTIVVMDTSRFADIRPLGARPEWIGGVHYALVDTKTGRKVRGCHSGAGDRYLLPGEMVHICDEWGYWRQEPPVMLVGENAEHSDWLLHYADETGDHVVDRHVVRDVIAAA